MARRLGWLLSIVSCVAVLLVLDGVRAQTVTPPSENSGTFNASQANYDALHAQVTQMHAAKQSRDLTQDMVEAWVQAQGVDSLSVEKARWCLQESLPQQADRKAFTATWTGQLTAPQAGQYAFSVSPINVNKSLQDEVTSHTITATVNGNVVVSATPDNWNWQGEPIQLQAGQPVALRVELIYSSSDASYSDSPHALLYWQGPGIARQIVPTSVLTVPNGQGNGLQAEYHWTESGQPRQAIQLNPNIEFAWASCRDVAPRNPQLIAALTNRFWNACKDPAYLAQRAVSADQAPRHDHPYFRNYIGTEYLTCAQRRQFLQLLNQNPALLQRADGKQVVRLYESLRFGDDQAALDMLGNWMQQRADTSPDLVADFFASNRHVYRIIANYLVWRMPGQDKLLQDRYLTMADGRCCLPVAYVLAYSNLMSGHISDWIDFLDAKLKDQTIIGDRRVNWLLARAQGEEIRDLSPGRNYTPQEDFYAGSSWLDEAGLVAETSGIKLRISKERITRLIGLNQWPAVDQELAHAGDSSPESQQAVAIWRTSVDAIKAAVAAQADAQHQASAQAYLDELTRRRAAAAARGDSDALTSYDSILGQVQTPGNSNSR